MKKEYDFHGAREEQSIRFLRGKPGLLFGMTMMFWIGSGKRWTPGVEEIIKP